MKDVFPAFCPPPVSEFICETKHFLVNVADATNTVSPTRTPWLVPISTPSIFSSSSIVLTVLVPIVPLYDKCNRPCSDQTT